MRHPFRSGFILTIVSVAAIFAVALCRGDNAPKQYILAGKLLDVRSGKVLEDQVITVAGEKIEGVAPAKQVQIPDGARVVDLNHSFVLPGLIDAHTHILLVDESRDPYDEQLLKKSWQYRTIEATVNARKDLEAGFTSMRDLETEGAMYSDVDVRNAINNGLIPGPRLQVATRALSVTGGYPLEGYSPEVVVPTGVQIVDSPDAARLAVREQIKYGANLIKVYATHHFHFTPDGSIWNQPTFTPAEMGAIVNEAHRQGVKVACHAYGGEGLHNCIDAGVDSIEHGLLLDDSSIREMVAKGIYFVPTLYAYETIAAQDLIASGGLTSRARIHEVSFKKALRAGVKIAFGTDVGAFPHGTQAKEFEYMVKFGMAPLYTIDCATLEAAALMGWSDRVGAIEPGKFADIVAVQGNPLEDITELERTTFVMKGGQVVRNDTPQAAK
jgi:imidazolonepropionase-like amidohydrolase